MTARDTTTDPRGWLEDHLGPLSSCDAMFCVPVIEPPTARHAEQWNLTRQNLLVVDHTPELAWQDLASERGWRYVPAARNLGTAGAWNLGRQILLDEYRPQDLLVLMSSYCDLPQGLEAVRWELRYNASWKGVQVNGYAWHLIAFSGALFRELGGFDENLPHYWGDNDFVYRGILAGHFLAGADSFHAIDIDASPPQSGGALRSKKLEDFSYRDYAAYFRAKWGGDAGSEQFLTPFGLPVPTSWWSPRYRPTVEEDGTPGWLPFVEGAA